MFIIRAFISLGKKAMKLFRRQETDDWLTPKLYTGKSMCEMGKCDCDRGGCICCSETITYTPRYWEERWIEQLSKKEEGEPEFVTKRKQEMIKLIKEGRGEEIVYDEWGEVFCPIDPEKK